MKRFAVLWVFIAVIMMFAAVSARAEVLTFHDGFDLTLGPTGAIEQGGGTGYDGDGDGIGDWYEYQSGWINEWFYNGPFDPQRWKHMWGFININPMDPDYAVDIVINWATPEWHFDNPTASGPPLPSDTAGALENLYIGRMQITGFDPGATFIEFDEWIWDFNPEWISIDVMGYNVQLGGEIWHECIPEPATLSLLALGGVSVLARRRKR